MPSWSFNPQNLCSEYNLNIVFFFDYFVKYFEFFFISNGRTRTGTNFKKFTAESTEVTKIDSIFFIKFDEVHAL
jgi:hypothetical protein